MPTIKQRIERLEQGNEESEDWKFLLEWSKDNLPRQPVDMDDFLKMYAERLSD